MSLHFVQTSYSELMPCARDILGNLRIGISDAWEKSAPRKEFKIQKWPLQRGWWGVANVHVLRQCALLLPELPFNFPEFPFYFPEVPFCFLELPFWFPEMRFHFSKCPIVFQDCHCPLVFQKWVLFIYYAHLFPIMLFPTDYIIWSFEGSFDPLVVELSGIIISFILFTIKLSLKLGISLTRSSNKFWFGGKDS